MITSFEWRTSSKRVAVSAALSSGATGILFAIFQVQGWKVPKPLALGLIALMLLIIGAAIAVVIIDLARNIRAFLEHRSTHALWVLSDPPGLLDYEPDALRAQSRLNDEMQKLAKDTGRVGKRMDRARRGLARVQHKSGFVKQRHANRTARSLNRSAVYIEKRLAMLKTLVREIERNGKGLITILPLDTEENVDAARVLRDTTEETRTTIRVSIAQIGEYKKSVEEFNAINASRSLRAASGRLSKALAGIERTLKDFEKVSAGIVRDLDSRLVEESPRAA